MTDFLLELRSEEIPARMQAKAKNDLSRLFAEEIAKAGLKAVSIETFATPRRLALIARGLPAETISISEERKGPRANAPEAALAGFLRSTGLTRDQLTERDGVLFAVIDKPGRPTADVLAEIIPAIIRAFPWPKSMRWGDASISTESLRWVRPLQGIVALFGEQIVDCEIDGIRSGAMTLGHRFHHAGPITIGSADDYVEKLRMCHVIVHHSERKKLIEDGAAKAAAAAGLTVIPDEGLVLENAGLTEWPVPLLGRFDPAFLNVPREVIQLTMRTNQKYFACTDADGQLANAFICTANIDANDGGAAVIAGNEKVLSARLSDAKFFWEADLKMPLEEQAKKLSQVISHAAIGTVVGQVERIAALAVRLVENSVLDGLAPTNPQFEKEELVALARRAALLCKADLVTQTVAEFPELQGHIGGALSLAQGESPSLATALEQQYKPVGSDDVIPQEPLAVAVAISEKLESLITFFALGHKPSGSKDPYALRRAALSVILIIIKNNLRFKISDAINWIIGRVTLDVGRVKLLTSDHDDVKPAEDWARAFLSGRPYQVNNGIITRLNENGVDEVCDGPEHELIPWMIEVHDIMLTNAKALVSFFADRLKVQQREAGVRHDLIDAVFALGGEDDLVRLLARVKALQGFVGTDEGKNLLSGYKRAANILKKEGIPTAVVIASAGMTKPLSYTPEIAETALIDALDTAEPLAAAAVEREDFEAAMSALASLRAPIDAFFETVTVNDPDPAKRDARLVLLARVRDAVHRVADFSKIDG